MNRRTFLRRLGAASVGVASAPLLALLPAPKPLQTPSIRYIQNYDVPTDTFVSRIDVLYGYGSLRPSLACKVLA